jgi:hypothetical protein
MRHKNNGYRPLLNNETRRLIEADLKIAPEILRNNLSALRAKGLLVDNEIPEKYLVKYLQNFDFQFEE